MALEQLTVTLTGTLPLLMHSNLGVNPRHPLNKEKKALTSKRAKSEEDLDYIDRLDWELGMYYDPAIGPYIPATMLIACLRDAAKKTKQGKVVVESVFINEEKIPLHYSGPRDLEALYASGLFLDVRPVKVQTARINRVRPIFREWRLTFTLMYDAEFMDRADLLRIFDTAGQRIGIGDYRPTFGRFTVTAA